MHKRYQSRFKDGHQADICAEYPNLWPVVDYGIFACGSVVAFCPTEWDSEVLEDQLNFLEELKKKHLPSSGI